MADRIRVTSLISGTGQGSGLTSACPEYTRRRADKPGPARGRGGPPTYADVLAALPAARRRPRPTPRYEWPALSRLLGCRHFLRHEDHTPATALKVRGGAHPVPRLPAARAARRLGPVALTIKCSK